MASFVLQRRFAAAAMSIPFLLLCAGDDGAIALACSLSSNTQLRRLWLQHNAIGPPGAMALATAMQHNASCTSLKLLQGNEAVPRDLAQMAQKLAWHNRG